MNLGAVASAVKRLSNQLYATSAEGRLNHSLALLLPAEDQFGPAGQRRNGWSKTAFCSGVSDW
jgi:hypothetical protein